MSKGKRRILALKRLLLVNFRSWKRLELNFSTGIMGIAGPVGSGKSNIIEAISIGLMGMAGTQLDKKALRYQGAPVNEPTAIELWLDGRDGEFRVRREFRGVNMTPSAALWLNGKRIADNTTSGVNRELAIRLGISKLLFAGRICRQHEVRMMEDRDPRQREKIMLEMLGLSDIELTVQSLREEFTQKNSELGALRRSLPSAAEIADRRSKAEEELGRYTLQITAASAQKEAMEAAERQATAELDGIKELARQARALESERQGAVLRGQKAAEDVARAQADLRDLDQKAERLTLLRKETEPLPALLEEHAQLAKYLQAYQVVQAAGAEVKRIRGQVEAATSWIATQREKIAALGDVKAAIQMAEPELAAALEAEARSLEALGKVQAEQAKLEGALEAAEKQLAERAAMQPGEPCPLCGVPVADVAHLAAEAQAAVASSRQALAAIAQAVTAAQVARQNAAAAAASARDRVSELRQKQVQQQALAAALKAKEEELERLQQELGAARDRLNEARANLPDIGEVTAERCQRVDQQVKRLRPLANEVIALEGALSERPRFEEHLAAAERRVREIEAEKAKLALRFEALGFDPARLAAAEAAVAEAKQRVSEQSETIAALQRESGRAEEAIRQCERDMEALRSQEAAIEELAEEVRILQSAISTATQFRVYLTNKIRPTLSYWVTEIYNEIADERFDRFEVSPKYDLLVYKDGAEYRARDMLSGGQREMAYLALRLAAATFAGGDQMDWLILDEAFAAVDVAMQARLGQVLRKLKRRWGQIITVAHSQVAIDSMDTVVNVSYERGCSVLVQDGGAELKGA